MNDFLKRTGDYFRRITPLGWATYGLAIAVILADQLSKTLALSVFVRHCPEHEGPRADAGRSPWRNARSRSGRGPST